MRYDFQWLVNALTGQVGFVEGYVTFPHFMGYPVEQTQVLQNRQA